MKIVIVYFICILSIFAQSFSDNARVLDMSLSDQFDRREKLRADGIWLIGWDKESTALINNYVDSHKAVQKKLHVIVDTSQIPSGIFTLFVKPNFQAYRHAIYLSFDEHYNKKLPYKEGYATYLLLDRGVIQKIEYFATQKRLESLLK